ncbi:PLDc N-terminal domain-containing protein [Paraliobacillus sp. JSM ZJ581]|uniref:PLDc N-terminal domain-containing protein n=1 Tax=Paraliobacillus sp. JSM ZJ581 TaxID=3342118 RepID=UPI0035A9715C
MNTDISILKDIDWGAIMPIVIPIMVLHLLLLIIALIDLYRRRTIVNYPIVWVVVIVLLNTVGPILYLTIGRRLLKNDRY